MKYYKDYFSGLDATQTWHIVGKGPSLNLFDQVSKTFNVIGLNHAVKYVKCQWFHCIDYNVFLDCKVEICEQELMVLMPLHPHFDNGPTKTTLYELILDDPFLEELSNTNRLVFYDHLDDDWRRHWNIPSTGEARNRDEIIDVRSFGAEAVVDVLGKVGVKYISTFGVDGGTRYDSKVSDTTRLINGQPDFDMQFHRIIKQIDKYDICYREPVDNGVIKVYVGASIEQNLAVKVLSYSIMKSTDAAVEVLPLYNADIEIPIPIDKKNQSRTSFSFQRFLIPELNSYTGRAIYLDSDMLVLGDIAQLWNFPMGQIPLLSINAARDYGRGAQYAVMLMNCESCSWSIRSIIQSMDSGLFCYEDLLGDMCVESGRKDWIPSSWNMLDAIYDSGKLIHYTDMTTQPWLYPRHRESQIWISFLISAVKEGYIDMDLIKAEVELTHVLPSLLWMVENDIDEYKSVPESIQLHDRQFVPPYKK